MSKRILFSRSGGGMPGLDIHAGIWLALEEDGVGATDCVGTSAGAIVSAFDAAGYSAVECTNLLAALRDEDVRRERLAWKLRLPWIDHFLEHAPIAAFLRAHLPKEFAALTKPLTCRATDEETAESVGLASGDLTPALLASMSISGVWPAVHLQGRVLSDGGTTANVPLPADLAAFDEVWLLVTRRQLDYRRRNDSILSRLIWNLDLQAEHEVISTVREARRRHPRVRLIRPSVCVTRGLLRFDHRLIGAARLATGRILSVGHGWSEDEGGWM